MNSKLLLLPTALMVAGHSAAEAKGKKSDKRPNILVILADDLGYSDLGCYGSEIHTPNLDKLAQEGVRFNHFYNASRSCPTRASLLTGLYQHQAGIGRMTFDAHLPGYRGTLSRNAVTIAEVWNLNDFYSEARRNAMPHVNNKGLVSTDRKSVV